MSRRVHKVSTFLGNLQQMRDKHPPTTTHRHAPEHMSNNTQQALQGIHAEEEGQEGAQEWSFLIQCPATIEKQTSPHHNHKHAITQDTHKKHNVLRNVHDANNKGMVNGDTCSCMLRRDTCSGTHLGYNAIRNTRNVYVLLHPPPHKSAASNKQASTSPMCFVKYSVIAGLCWLQI